MFMNSEISCTDFNGASIQVSVHRTHVSVFDLEKDLEVPNAADCLN